mmetsp:Transcript_35570/g.80225  ORF Transcript_35570/g.80225 Transcript_35570/m.80225 type:complete len:293 (+) Transcript_35570:129-1007(+)|eukprot:CAMPEP_0172597848 /NCGR_PEP_ID=MMETSP1068-20121228/17826_1 /TAXON_ID=35684 /ORGANISM="Pseudopedinella elastica, Strain CCMP716" /LENGTH=292 /DNA_ID=CAMNT_0013397475 /DNA_START=57 /DNA_END=935 /DNA_ORIENTATION=-
MSRPELQVPPDLFYNKQESRKYTSSSRIIKVQNEIAQRCIELLNLPEDKTAYILDCGCGSGLSGQALEEAGHVWVGCDISPSMLEVAAEQVTGDEEGTGDLLRHDMGLGLPFNQATFDGCISVSALQWLCYADVTGQTAKRRLTRFFSSLYTCLKRGSKAALQFYPETPEQAVLIAQCASAVGFMGGLVVDYPNSSKAKKYYLCLGFAGGGGGGYSAPAALADEAAAAAGEREGVSFTKADKPKQDKSQKRRKGPKAKGKDWVLEKKERRRAANKETRRDSKYTARKRKDKF